MVYLAFATVLYVAGFVFLYGVVRIGVRHAIEDAELRRERALRELERPAAPRRPPASESASLAGS